MRRIINEKYFVLIICAFICLLASDSTAQHRQPETLWDIKDAEESLERFDEALRFEWSGKIWNKFGYDIHEDTNFESDYSNHAEIQIEAKYLHNDRAYALISVDVDYFTYYHDTDSDDDDIKLHNAYINLAGSGYNFKLGNQIVRWGKSDGYSPLDNINPEDFRDGIGGRREDRKIPIPILNIELYKDSNTFQWLFIPFFKQSELDFIGTNWSLFDHVDKNIGPLVLKETEPADNFRNSEMGIRFSGMVRNFDYAFSYFRTREDTPIFDFQNTKYVLPDSSLSSVSIKELISYCIAEDQEIFFRYERQNIYGFEFETTVGDFGLRGDVAYTYRRSFITNELTRINKPVFQYMLGADYTGPEDYYANFQFTQTYIQNYDNRIILADKITSAINGSFWKEYNNGDFKLEFRYFYDLSGSMRFCNPKIFFNNWKNFSIEIGAEFFDGSKDSDFVFFRDNDQVYGIIEIKF